MRKLYVVRRRKEERGACQRILSRDKGPAHRIRQASSLLSVDANGAAATHHEAARSTPCHASTVCNDRQRFVERDFEAAPEGKRLLASPPPVTSSGDSRHAKARYLAEQIRIWAQNSSSTVPGPPHPGCPICYETRRPPGTANEMPAQNWSTGSPPPKMPASNARDSTHNFNT